jgi:cytochrome oxidase Cu insertion factor (SCO1/SenC/PrrC family)
LRNRLIGILLLTVLSLAGTAAFGQEKKKEAPAEPLKLKVGDMAPDFTLLEYDGSKIKAVSLHDYKGKKSVALAFFVFAFTGG